MNLSGSGSGTVADFWEHDNKPLNLIIEGEIFGLNESFEASREGRCVMESAVLANSSPHEGPGPTDTSCLADRCSLVTYIQERGVSVVQVDGKPFAAVERSTLPLRIFSMAQQPC
jgi:hypothetical protein